MLTTSVVNSEARLDRHAAGWDALAVECRRPLVAPGWLLPWWRHLAPEGAELRTVVMEDGGKLIGIAPFYVERSGDHRLLGSGYWQRIEPLAAPGREEEVAAEVAMALGTAEPSPGLVSFEAVPESSPWPELLKGALGGPLGSGLSVAAVWEALVMDLPSDFDAWLQSKSRHFRQRIRSSRRKLEAAGGVVRVSKPDDVECDIRSLLRLHEGRWTPRGGSEMLQPGIEPMLREAARNLLPSGRFRLVTVDFGDETICAQLSVAAGGEVAGVTGGFDTQHAALRATMVAIVRTIEDAIAKGDKRLDLGLGKQEWKLRLADRNDPLLWCVVVPRNARWLLIRARTAPQLARWRVSRWAREHLSEERRRKLKSLAP